jgi:hypothetical protein
VTNPKVKALQSARSKAEVTQSGQSKAEAVQSGPYCFADEALLALLALLSPLALSSVSPVSKQPTHVLLSTTDVDRYIASHKNKCATKTLTTVQTCVTVVAPPSYECLTAGTIIQLV